MAYNQNTKSANTENPRNLEEAFLTIQIIASFKQHALKVDKTEQLIVIKHRHERLLHLVLYLILVALPLFIFKDSLKNVYPTLSIYYLFFLLLVWNITRGTKVLKIDRENKKVHLSNLDFLGKVLHPARTYTFNELMPFEAKFESGHFGGTGKNMIHIVNQKNKSFPMFKIKSEGAGLTNGHLLSNSLNALCDLSSE